MKNDSPSSAAQEAMHAAAHQALLEGVRIATSQEAFAKLIGVSQQAVSRMIARKKGLPFDYVVNAVKGTGIPSERYRPELLNAVVPTPSAPPLIDTHHGAGA